MSFLAQNDLIRVSDNGRVVFDTTRKMPILTGTITGSVYMPARGPNVSGTVIYDLGPSVLSPSFVFPTFRVTQATTAEGVVGAPNGVPYSACGSSVVYAKWTFTDIGYLMTGSRVLTAMLLNGRVVIVEDYSEWEGANQVGAATVDYRIYMGQFQ